MSIRELKSALQELNIDTSDCIEKTDLVDKLMNKCVVVFVDSLGVGLCGLLLKGNLIVSCKHCCLTVTLSLLLLLPLSFLLLLLSAGVAGALHSQYYSDLTKKIESGSYPEWIVTPTWIVNRVIPKLRTTGPLFEYLTVRIPRSLVRY